MKRLLLLLAFVPLFAACDFDKKLEEMTKLSPTIKGFSYSKITASLGDADAEQNLTAIIIAGSDWEGKNGDKVDFQIQVIDEQYGGQPDKLGIYYFLTGKATYNSSSSITIAVDGYTALNGTWTFAKEEVDGEKRLNLDGDGKNVVFKFWHETE